MLTTATQRQAALILCIDYGRRRPKMFTITPLSRADGEMMIYALAFRDEMPALSRYILPARLPQPTREARYHDTRQAYIDRHAPRRETLCWSSVLRSRH